MIRTKVICNSKYLRKYVSIFVRNNNNSTGPNEGSKTVVRSMWVGLPHQIKGRWLIDRRSNAMSLWLQNIIISSFAAIESVPAPRVPMRRLFSL